MRPTTSFSQWFYCDRENKRFVLFSAVAIIISFIWLKIIYPFPNFMQPDSNSYLEAASNNNFINIWPIGYSRFLRFISSFSSSHFLLVSIQYLLIIASVLYFLFTIRYLLSPRTWPFRIVFILSVTNPMLPHIANFVSSDCLFTAFVLLWFTQLLWLLYKPSKNLLFLHSLVLAFIFTIRLSALYLPFFSIGAILFTTMSKKLKWAGVGSITLLLLTIIGRTQYEYKVKTGTVQYSAFSGWQLAANALYAYAHSPLDSNYVYPVATWDLHAIVNRHMDSLRTLAKRPDEAIGIYYMWDAKSPLRVNMSKYGDKVQKKSFFQQWSSFAPMYFTYGKSIITRHPVLYVQYFMWPNLKRFYEPPANSMKHYNFASAALDSIVIKWFDWKTNLLPTKNWEREITTMSVFPTIVASLNSLFLIFSFAFIAWVGFKSLDIVPKRLLTCTLFVWWTNLFFSILTAPIELRYELFSIIIMLPFAGIFLEKVIYSLQSVSPRSQNLAMPLPDFTKYV